MKAINEILAAPGLTLAPLNVTRNEVTFPLDVRTGEKKEAKGMQYYGITITKDNFATQCVNIGIDILAPIVDTAVNTKMQTFCEAALTECIGEGQINIDRWNALTAQARYDAFTTMLKSKVEKWSAREVTVKALTERMADLGRELSNPATTDTRRAEILSKDMPEIAMAMATK
jgi:hypothetical protein